jgi:hypothetical protein
VAPSLARRPSYGANATAGPQQQPGRSGEKSPCRPRSLAIGLTGIYESDTFFTRSVTGDGVAIKAGLKARLYVIAAVATVTTVDNLTNTSGGGASDDELS